MMDEIKENLERFNDEMNKVEKVNDQLLQDGFELKKAMLEYEKKLEEVQMQIKQNREEIEKNSKNKTRLAEIYLNRETRDAIIEQCKKECIPKNKIEKIEKINKDIENGIKEDKDNNEKINLDRYKQILEYGNILLKKKYNKVDANKKSSFLTKLYEKFFKGGKDNDNLF